MTPLARTFTRELEDELLYRLSPRPAAVASLARDLGVTPADVGELVGNLRRREFGLILVSVRGIASVAVTERGWPAVQRAAEAYARSRKDP